MAVPILPEGLSSWGINQGVVGWGLRGAMERTVIANHILMVLTTPEQGVRKEPILIPTVF